MNLEDVVKGHLPKGVADALFEQEAAPEKPFQQSAKVPPIQWQPPAPALVSVVNSTSAGTITVTSSAVSSILADLRAKTNFETTPVGQQLKESTDALADTGLDDLQKSKTAMKLSHQSPAQVVAVLQGLQAVLVAETQHFEATMQTATTAEVSARQAKSAQLQSSIDAAEAQLASFRQEKSAVDLALQDKQNKINSAKANYAAASEARNTEIAEMISHYQSIPEVK